jgi:hypothetical protein
MSKSGALLGAYDAPMVSGIHSRSHRPARSHRRTLAGRRKARRPAHPLLRRIPAGGKSETRCGWPRPRYARIGDTQDAVCCSLPRPPLNNRDCARLPCLPPLARPRLKTAVETHLRMHKPVAVLPAGHPGPSGAPAEQTTDTNTSFSLQATVLSPVTMRNAAAPAAPGGPVSP